MKKSKILIFGGGGFIGRNLASTLADRGALVYSFDKAIPEKRDRRIEYIAGDFFDDDHLDDALEGKDAVIHAVSTVNPGNSNKRYMQGYGRDFVQSVKLCEKVLCNRQRMLFLSSGGTVYGNQEVQPITEECFPLPINHYGNVKLCIENVIRTFNTQLHTKMRDCPDIESLWPGAGLYERSRVRRCGAEAGNGGGTDRNLGRWREYKGLCLYRRCLCYAGKSPGIQRR